MALPGQANIMVKDLPLEGEPFSFDTNGPQLASDKELAVWYEMFENDNSIPITVPIFNKMKELGHAKMVKADCYQANRVLTHPCCSNYEPDPESEFRLCQNGGFISYEHEQTRKDIPVVYFATKHGEIIAEYRTWWTSTEDVKSMVCNEMHEVIGRCRYIKKERGGRNITKYLTRSYTMLSGTLSYDGYRMIRFSDNSSSGHNVIMGYGEVILSTFDKDRPCENGVYWTVGHLHGTDNNEVGNIEWQSMSMQNLLENRRHRYLNKFQMFLHFSIRMTSNPYVLFQDSR